MSSLIFLSVLSLLLQCPLPSLSNSEGDALYAFKKRLYDPNNVLESWDPTEVDPCTWFHVTCDYENNVSRLDLGNYRLAGTLAPELGQLRHLGYLELYGNNISGNIPVEFGNLGNLISMDLSNNRLEGHIPESFGKLKSLRILLLNNNQLTGSIPREIALLENLVVFNVSNNHLSYPSLYGNFQ